MTKLHFETVGINRIFVTMCTYILKLKNSNNMYALNEQLSEKNGGKDIGRLMHTSCSQGNPGVRG